ncbi:IclR family transcriptional regulator C-terminal domain-containing protein [Paenibacillus sp. BK720]|uniref:IclR family transcriptional regulator n=1 Tax=Paenibacillus sp. BK720 TaxID=2587092 RepID=UPI00141FFFBD|nr:IclR family transcriptional regulator C-terminal domain-containing protein [Paenibacillus sp. BK720]NIK69410.1 DNA-binding IclR family transcriptional regulator [Paenibacillus sp. BK720]
MPGYEVSSLKKGLQMVDLLRERRRLNLTDISKAIAVNKTTVFRLLHTLEEMKYVIKLGKEYELHPRLFQERQSVRETIKWSKLQALCRLGEQAKKDVFAGTLEGAAVMVRLAYEAETGQLADREITGPVPACQTAAGKAILAQLSRSEQLRLFTACEPGQATKHTFTDPDLFLRHLAVIKQQGFAADYEEYYPGLLCVASPVFCKDKAVASIAVADRLDVMPKSETRSLTRKVINAAKEITRELNTYVSSLE